MVKRYTNLWKSMDTFLDWRSHCTRYNGTISEILASIIQRSALGPATSSMQPTYDSWMQPTRLWNLPTILTFFISERQSVVCRLPVCNARAPYWGGWNFRQYFYGIWYLGHPL